MKRLVCLLFLAVVAQAQAPPSFREGVLAFEKGDYKLAEQKMREAVAGNPNETEGTVSIAGSWYETYVPHYFLARALAKQGKCEEALREFAESERQGVTPAISDFARHLKTRGGCRPQTKPEKPPRVVGEVEVPFGEEPVSKPAAPVPVKPTPTPVSKPTPVTPAPRVVEDPAIIEARAQLKIAVQSYLRGDYDLTLRLLNAASFRDRAAAAEAALFRAAARYALFRIGGETDGSLRGEMEGDLRTYRDLRPNGKPDGRIFPPGFIAALDALPR